LWISFVFSISTLFKDLTPNSSREYYLFLMKNILFPAKRREVGGIRPIHSSSLSILIVPFLLIFYIACSPAEQTPASRIEWTDLPPSIIKKAPDLRTGYLIVPEYRSQMNGRRTIGLPFIIIKSRSSSPSSDPVLITAGGPGGSILVRARNRSRSPLLERHDVILFEQRGTRYAEPALLGPQIDAAFRSGWGSRLNGKPDPALMEAALAKTLQDYKEMGVELEGYTTKESASDIIELRKLLGIESWNLYGISYSTKLMLAVMRDDPSGVRSAILDSVLPNDVNWDEEAPANILEVFRKVLSAAREDMSLKARLKGIEDRWIELLTEANNRPIELDIKNSSDGSSFRVRLDAAGIMNCIYAGLEDPEWIPRLPLIIEAACEGHVSVLAPLAEIYLESFLGYAWGMRLSVWCNEEFPFERPESILHPIGLPRELTSFVQAAVPLEALHIWPQGSPAQEENEPVISKVPVLIAAGEFDPDTPVKWAYSAAAHLPNAQVIEFAGMSHVPLFAHPEANRIMREFFIDPKRKVDPGRTAVRPPFATSLEDSLFE
jgi:pimeloyl-ACP methyl ester carboxylesterase